MVARRTDDNQREIVAALRAIGATVQDLSAVGKGCPDLLVGMQGRNLLLEVKKPPGPRGGQAGKLTEDQVSWHGSWRGQVAIVSGVSSAVQAVLGR